jgi:nicotinamide mononucleotide adenylyltransferase
MHNPLTYFERVEMIKNVLLENGFGLREFDIVPFPIETPDCLAGFIPTSIPIFTTINDDWNLEKIKLLRKIGYKVIILWEDREKEFNGVNIRELIRKGDEGWKEQVPPATADIIERYRIRNRLLKLTKDT